MKAFGGLGGDDVLTRAPRGYDPDHPLIEDIKRKSFFAMHEADVKLAASPKLVDAVAETFKAASPLMKFLCSAGRAVLDARSARLRVADKELRMVLV